jgi:hypothetical protein
MITSIEDQNQTGWIVAKVIPGQTIVLASKDGLPDNRLVFREKEIIEFCEKIIEYYRLENMT